MEEMKKRQVVSLYANRLLEEAVGDLPPTTAARVWVTRYLRAARPAGKEVRQRLKEEAWQRLAEAARGLGAQALLEAEDPEALLATLARGAGVDLGPVSREAAWGLLDDLAREVARREKEGQNVGKG